MEAARAIRAVALAAVLGAGAGDAAELPDTVLPTPAVSFGTPAELRARVLDLFREAVLVDETKRDRGVSKWTGSATVSLRGAHEEYDSFTARLVAELSSLTGLDMALTTGGDDIGDIDIYLSHRADYWPFHPRPLRAEDRIFTCVAAPRIRQGRIEHATIRINAARLSRETVEACLVEEIVQSLGLLGETSRERDTILNDEIGYRGLGPIDRLLLEVLYDPRLAPGLASREALPLAAEILEEKTRTLRCATAREGRPACRFTAF